MGERPFSGVRSPVSPVVRPGRVHPRPWGWIGRPQDVDGGVRWVPVRYSICGGFSSLPVKSLGRCRRRGCVLGRVHSGTGVRSDSGGVTLRQCGLSDLVGSHSARGACGSGGDRRRSPGPGCHSGTEITWTGVVSGTVPGVESGTVCRGPPDRPSKRGRCGLGSWETEWTPSVSQWVVGD